MEKRKLFSVLLLILGAFLSLVFISKIQFPQGLETYFKREFYNQFGPLVIGIELLVAGYYLFRGNEKTNFALALFGFTALLDALFNLIGLFDSLMPLYASIIVSICGLICLWMAFSNSFKFNGMSILRTMVSVIIGVMTELFFNYF